MKGFFNGLFALGLFVGLVAGFSVNQFLFSGVLKGPGLAQYVAAVLGAVVGGGISLLAQMLASESERVKRNEERHDIQKATAFALISRIHAALEEVGKVKSHCLQDDPRYFVCFGEDGRLRKPLSGVHKPVSFPEEVLTLPLILGKAELYNDLREIESATETLVYLQSEYETAFNSFISGLTSQGGVMVKGRRISGAFEVKQTDLLLLCDLQAHIEKMSNSLFPTVLRSEKAVSEILESKFGTRLELEVNEQIPGGVFSED